MTTAHARIIADMLSDAERGFLRLMGKDSVMGMSEPAKQLKELALIKEKDGLWQFTANGKKVLSVLEDTDAR